MLLIITLIMSVIGFGSFKKFLRATTDRSLYSILRKQIKQKTTIMVAKESFNLAKDLDKVRFLHLLLSLDVMNCQLQHSPVPAPLVNWCNTCARATELLATNVLTQNDQIVLVRNIDKMTSKYTGKGLCVAWFEIIINLVIMAMSFYTLYCCSILM